MKLITVRKIVLALLASWLSLVVFVAFIVEPSLFEYEMNAALAGEISVRIFSLLGTYEVVVSIFLFITAGIIFKLFKTRRSAFLFLFATSLIGLALLGKFYLSPELSYLNSERHTLAIESAEYPKVKNRHEFFKSFAAKSDGLKMLLLFAGMIGSFRASRFDQEKVFVLQKRSKS